MTKQKLIDKNQRLEAEIAFLKTELATLKKLIFGSKKERFISSDLTGNQLGLFDTPIKEEEKESVNETITYTRKKKKHPGRHKIPDHLPVEEIILEPEEDVSNLKKIGEERSETLKYTPASLVKLVRVRPKYETKDGSVLIADLPERALPKSIAESSFLSHIFVSKFIDHLPFYRQRQIFKRDFGLHLSDSTMSDWLKAVCLLLEPLYEQLEKQVISGTYLQVDESPLQVLDHQNKQGKSHKGYQWVYLAPEQGLVLFKYRKGRGQHGPKETLANFKGYIQTDGYRVYDAIVDKRKEELTLLACWAHVRRKFFEAKDNHAQIANHVLEQIQQIYLLERRLKESKATPKEILETRQTKTKNIMKSLKAYLDEQYPRVLPQSKIGKAIYHAKKQWEKLEHILLEARFHLDNNWVENAIRPLALGRKNYLFAGSHDGAKRIAMMYSFFATCKRNEINPRKWLNYVLDNIATQSIQQLDDLLPNNFKKQAKL